LVCLGLLDQILRYVAYYTEHRNIGTLLHQHLLSMMGDGYLLQIFWYVLRHFPMQHNPLVDYDFFYRLLAIDLEKNVESTLLQK
jgi:hypothetical protein